MPDPARRDEWTLDLTDWSEEEIARLLGDRPWVGASAPSLAFPIHARFGRSADGRLVCTGLLLGGAEPREITSRALHAIPVGGLIEAVVSARDDEEIGSVVRAAMQLSDTPDPAEVVAPRRRPGSGGYGREHFEAVAAAYRAALTTAPRAPVREMARRLGTSEATARRWVQRARDMDLLGAAQPGKAGELSGDEEGAPDGSTEDPADSGR